MPIKSGQVLFTGSGFILDRLQSASAAANVPTDRVNELGNERSVGIVRDTPDLSFSVDSYDVSPKFEAMILGIDPTTLTSGQQIDFNKYQPLSVLSPLRSSQTNFAISGGAIIPHLSLSKVNYRFGVKADASQSYEFRGDSLFYAPATPWEATYTGDGTTTSWTLPHTAIQYFSPTIGATQYVLSVTVMYADGSFGRLFNGAAYDFTDTSTGFSLNAGVAAPPAGSTIKVQFFTTFAETLAQTVNDADGVAVKPAAIRARDIDIFIGTAAATPVFTRWPGVQSFDCTWGTAGAETTFEFGNALSTASDYVTATVDGTLTMRAYSVAQMLSQIATASNVSSSQVIGALSSSGLPIEIHLNNPDTGARLKTLYIPDFRADLPNLDIRVNNRLDTQFKFMSDTGQLYVYNGARPGGVSTP